MIANELQSDPSPLAPRWSQTAPQVIIWIEAGLQKIVDAVRSRSGPAPLRTSGFALAQRTQAYSLRKSTTTSLAPSPSTSATASSPAVRQKLIAKYKRMPARSGYVAFEGESRWRILLGGRRAILCS